MKFSKRFNKLKKKSKKRDGFPENQGARHSDRRAAQQRREQQTSTSSYVS